MSNAKNPTSSWRRDMIHPFGQKVAIFFRWASSQMGTAIIKQNAARGPECANSPGKIGELGKPGSVPAGVPMENPRLPSIAW
jgi:hypothetical protein